MHVNIAGVCCISYGYNIVVALNTYSCKAEIHGKLGRSGLGEECQEAKKFLSQLLDVISSASVIHH